MRSGDGLRDDPRERWWSHGPQEARRRGIVRLGRRWLRRLHDPPRCGTRCGRARRAGRLVVAFVRSRDGQGCLLGCVEASEEDRLAGKAYLCPVSFIGAVHPRSDFDSLVAGRTVASLQRKALCRRLRHRLLGRERCRLGFGRLRLRLGCPGIGQSRLFSSGERSQEHLLSGASHLCLVADSEALPPNTDSHTLIAGRTVASFQRNPFRCRLRHCLFGRKRRRSGVGRRFRRRRRRRFRHRLRLRLRLRLATSTARLLLLRRRRRLLLRLSASPPLQEPLVRFLEPYQAARNPHFRVAVVVHYVEQPARVAARNPPRVVVDPPAGTRLHAISRPEQPPP